MKNIKKVNMIKAFTLVEIIVVVTIIIILSTIGFISYTSNIKDSRNAARLSDIGNINMSLKNHKFKNGTYPIPGDSFDITNSGTIIKQGFLNDEVYTMELDKKPKDPLIDNYYLYSITNNKLFFNIAMSMEKDNNSFYAKVDGDYQSINESFVPTLVFATNTGADIYTISNKFIVDMGTLNLPYDKNGYFISTATSITDIINESGVKIPKFYGYYSCQEIYENGASMGSGTYMIIDNNDQLTSTGCSMNY